MPPRRVVITVLTLLLLMHGWLAWRLLPQLPVVLMIPLGVWLLLSTPLIARGLLARANKRQDGASSLEWLGLLSLGLFSTLMVLSLLREVLLWLPVPPAFTVWSAWGVWLIALLASAIGLMNARRRARVVTVEVPINQLPEDLQGFRIVQISDIHVGPTIRQPYLQAIVDAVNQLQPDVVAITGDLVDGSVEALSAHTAPLASLQARHGSYFVTGNHEYYSGAEPWVAEVRRLGITVLMNEHVKVQQGQARLAVAGVTDYTAHQFIPQHRSDPHAAIAGAQDCQVKVLLAHQPRTAPLAAEAGFHLQLSGHTHGGQFLPWNWLVPLQQPFVAGLNRLADMWIYTSRGTGYWGPPKRFGAPSEITLLKLVRA
ncbi:metallophosphoesterase [Leeia aquatica]|uniref:Metallophosphoesterase n=1 Tax=Leeia aquatica TaxID=2725557 RepID=A0A847S6I5_9NEIS|nr:metallophosphoesterase [Leeia aquatica]NLR75373.1 metallophosphoesterase [Leeia aquatica]